MNVLYGLLRGATAAAAVAGVLLNSMGCLCEDGADHAHGHGSSPDVGHSHHGHDHEEASGLSTTAPPAPQERHSHGPGSPCDCTTPGADLVSESQSREVGTPAGSVSASPRVPALSAVLSLPDNTFLHIPLTAEGTGPPRPRRTRLHLFLSTLLI